MVKRVFPQAYIFAAWMVLARNHAILALLSEFRRHHVQASANLRLMIESAVFGAYALTVGEDKEGPVYRQFTQKDRTKANKWIETHLPELSEQAKFVKNQFNTLDLHANLMHSVRVIDYGSFAEGELVTSFFEVEDSYAEKSWVWMYGASTLLAVEILMEAGTKLGGVEFVAAAANQRLKLRQQLEQFTSGLNR